MDSPSSTLSIPARPMPFTIDPSRTAVIVVDMQNDFASQGGAFARAGLEIVPVRNYPERDNRCWRRYQSRMLATLRTRMPDHESFEIVSWRTLDRYALRCLWPHRRG